MFKVALRFVVMVSCPQKRWFRGTEICCVLLVKGMDEIAEPREDLPIPAVPVEDAAMADGRLQMVLLAVGFELAAQILGDDGRYKQ